MLFADVRGYTTLTETLDPAESPALVNRFYTTASAALLKHEGLLGQIAGDEVEALFVPGLAGAGYRGNAVAGARALVAAVDWLDVGVGIASGQEFVGNVGGGGYKDFAAVGDVTNTAARLVSIAGRGEIVVDAETYTAVADAYPTARRRTLELKGKSEPVETYLIPS